MKLKCTLGFHDWNDCKCSKCGKTRGTDHDGPATIAGYPPTEKNDLSASDAGKVKPSITSNPVTSSLESLLDKWNTWNKNLTVFWFDTWAAWRSEELSTISDDPLDFFRVAAKGEFADFVKLSPKLTKRGTRTDTMKLWIARFFAEHEPRSGEFLISFDRIVDAWLPNAVLTSQRLWFRDKKTREYIVIELADVSDFRIKRGWASAALTFRFKNNTEHTYEYEACWSSDNIRFVVERCKTAKSAASEYSHSERNPQTRRLTSEREMILPVLRCELCKVEYILGENAISITSEELASMSTGVIGTMPAALMIGHTEKRDKAQLQRDRDTILALGPSRGWDCKVCHHHNEWKKY